MATEQTAEGGKDPREQLVGHYFHLIQQLRSGVEGSVERLVEMWHPEGTFEFAGAPPVTGTYVGRNAIHVLYQNRLLANGMRLRLKGGKGGRGGKGGMRVAGSVADTALGVVSTEVQRTRYSRSGWLQGGKPPAPASASRSPRTRCSPRPDGRAPDEWTPPPARGWGRFLACGRDGEPRGRGAQEVRSLHAV